MIDQLQQDLSRHFRQRVMEFISDQCDTAQRVEVPYKDTISMVASHLLGIAAMISIEHQIPKVEFMKLAGEIYSQMEKANA